MSKIKLLLAEKVRELVLAKLGHPLIIENNAVLDGCTIKYTQEPEGNEVTIVYDRSVLNKILGKPIVIQLRAGAPDKCGIWTDGSYELLKLDNINLVDFDTSDLLFCYHLGMYILPADEGDIYHINELKIGIIDPIDSLIMLPRSSSGVINYDEYVPKDSSVYENLEKFTTIKYPKSETLTLDQFMMSYSPDNLSKCAIKTTTGSGSRGVWIIDPERAELGHKCVSKLTDIQYKEFIQEAEKQEGMVMIQELCPSELLKCNTDFVIRDGRLMGYKWDLVNQSQQFTNWDNGYFIRNKYTDKLMKKVVKYLVEECGITDAIMNFESFSDLESTTWMIEFNWRYSNSMFETQAVRIDLISSYINKVPFELPEGYLKYIRYWQCKLYHDLID